MAPASGGSFGCAHRESGIAIGYALNHLGPELVGDPRATALCAATTASSPKRLAK